MAVVLMVLSAFKQDKVVTIFMIGDSTMANKSIKNGNKERGWGMALQCYFDDGIRIDNHAVNGRSSKSFIDEGRWQVVVDKIRPGDYVFIQFGHNDEKPKADRHTDPGTTFDANLSKFVRETRDKGGIPVLFNSVVRRNFMKVAPKNYVVAPRNVAKELGVVFVDANKITHELEQGMGREASRKLHMWFMPGEEPSIPKGRQDNTHYNIYGAHVVAGLLADAVSEEIPALKKHLVHRDMSVASNGIGDFFTVQEAVDNAVDGKKTTIQLFAGEWDRPTVSKGKKIKFVLREGAKWKK